MTSPSTNDNVMQLNQHNVIPRERLSLTPDSHTDLECNRKRTESIHKVLAKFITMN